PGVRGKRLDATPRQLISGFVVQQIVIYSSDCVFSTAVSLVLLTAKRPASYHERGQDFIRGLGALGAHLSLQEMRGSAGCEIAVVIAPRPRGLQPIRSPVSSLMEPRRLETNPHHTVKDVDVLDRGSSPWSEAVSRQLHPITSDNDLGIERPTDWLNRKQGSGQKVIALGVTTQVP
ncbi:Schlafen family member 13, partial [Dissostichus eleginoides]